MTERRSPPARARRRIQRILESSERRAEEQANLDTFRSRGQERARAGGTLPLVLSFYLPQFHPVPENDEWWGEGFTEWRNVASAKPLFRGHNQPDIPGALGFYDLRLEETRIAQARLAQQYGVGGFCYWHYWFKGRRLLNRPLDEVRATGKPDFPFCVSWANESWTRTWLGTGETLIEQGYSAEDDEAHARWLAELFSDRRYIRVGSRPLFLMYRPEHHPDPPRFLDALRLACRDRSIDQPLVLGMNGWSPRMDARTLGFDGTVDFQPQFGDLRGLTHRRLSFRRLLRNLKLGRLDSAGSFWDYRQAHEAMLARRLSLGLHPVPTVLVGWDNTPRRGRRAIVLTDNDAAYFGTALADELVDVALRPGQPQVVFVNAWNEWAEGNHLEPGLRNGTSHLVALQDGFEQARRRLGLSR